MLLSNFRSAELLNFTELKLLVIKSPDFTKCLVILKLCKIRVCLYCFLLAVVGEPKTKGRCRGHLTH